MRTAALTIKVESAAVGKTFKIPFLPSSQFSHSSSPSSLSVLHEPSLIVDIDGPTVIRAVGTMGSLCL